MRIEITYYRLKYIKVFDVIVLKRNCTKGEWNKQTYNVHTRS